jgi:DNA-binding HxlR family transcriptional regulator
VLLTKLKEPEHDGFVHRKVYATVLPKVEYFLTLRGIKVNGVH